MKDMKRILVIIVTYNAMKWVDRCLGSLRETLVPADVFVVDNSSSDGTQAYIQENYPEVKFKSTGENLGFGKANNIGLRYALEQGYDYVYLLNQDAWIFPDTLSALVAAMESDKSYGILSPMQMTSSEDRPDPRFAKWCPVDALQDWKSVREGNGVETQVYEVPFIMAAHWLISRECVEKTGGFSPSFPHYGEDDNYIHRAKYHGFRCGILSSAGAVHDREMRPMARQSAMKLKCIASVVKISNPLNCLIFRILVQPLELLAISLRYASSYVLKEMFRMIGKYPLIIRNRKISKEEGAFLE